MQYLVSIERMSEQDVEAVEKNIRQKRKLRPMLVIVLMLISTYPLLIVYFSSGKMAWMGISLSIFLALMSIFFIIINSGKIDTLRKDLIERKKLKGCFTVNDKDLFASHNNQRLNYLLILNNPKVNKVKVSDALWCKVAAGDEIYLEKSLHHGLILYMEHRGENVTSEARY